MGEPHGIIVFGASGAGTTTLARELARVLGVKHLDPDDYFWQKTERPFTVKRERDERVVLLDADVGKYRSFVISGSPLNWSAMVEPFFDLGVFVETRAAGYDCGGVDTRSRPAREKWIERLPCPVIRVDGAVDYKTTAVDIAKRFYVQRGEPMRVTTAPLNSLKKYRFSVIFVQYHEKWLFARHKERDTWETVGGHIERNESPIEAAKRELYEETGAVKFEIYPAFDYAVHRETEFSYGQVFFAEAETIEALPEYSEMAETRLFDDLPAEWTYPLIQPLLFEKIHKWLGLDSGGKEEYCDVYD